MVAVAHILRARSPHRALPLRARAGWRALASATPSHPLDSSVARKDVTHQPHPEARPRPPAYLSSILGVLSSAEWRPRCPTLPSRLSSSKTWPS